MPKCLKNDLTLIRNRFIDCCPFLPDRSGIENVNSVEALQETLIRALRSLITKNHPNESAIFTKLLLKLPDLRSLNNMHSEELLAFKVHS